MNLLIMTLVFFREIANLKKVELLKQQLISQHDYSVLAIFRLIDQYSHGKVNLDNLRIFMQKFECAQDLDEVDLNNWIKRYDTDVDGGLKFVDVVNALQTQTNYQPKLVQKANSKEFQRGSADSQNINMSISNIEQQPLLFNQDQGDILNQMRDPQIMINDQSLGQVENQNIMNAVKDIPDSSMTVGIKKSSYMNQPTRTTGFTSAIGGTATNLEMYSGI